MSSALLVRSNFQAEQVAIGVDPDPASHLGAARPGPTLSAVTKHTERSAHRHVADVKSRHQKRLRARLWCNSI